MKWRISVGKPLPPWQRTFHVTPPERCGCWWVCCDMDMAMRVVDLFSFAAQYPYMFDRVFLGYGYQQHLAHLKFETLDSNTVWWGK